MKAHPDGKDGRKIHWIQVNHLESVRMDAHRYNSTNNYCYSQIMLLFPNHVALPKSCCSSQIMLLFQKSWCSFQIMLLCPNHVALPKWRCSYQMMLLFPNDVALTKCCCSSRIIFLSLPLFNIALFNFADLYSFNFFSIDLCFGVALYLFFWSGVSPSLSESKFYFFSVLSIAI